MNTPFHLRAGGRPHLPGPFLNAAGVDGVIVQDIGLARRLTEWEGRILPRKLSRHASTQMTLSSPDGPEFAAGFLDLKNLLIHCLMDL